MNFAQCFKNWWHRTPRNFSGSGNDKFLWLVGTAHALSERYVYRLVQYGYATIANMTCKDGLAIMCSPQLIYSKVGLSILGNHGVGANQIRSHVPFAPVIFIPGYHHRKMRRDE